MTLIPSRLRSAQPTTTPVVVGLNSTFRAGTGAEMLFGEVLVLRAANGRGRTQSTFAT